MNTDHKKFASDLARQAGEIMRTNFTLGMKKKWKSDDTPLTASDVAIDNLVRERVQKHFPDYGIITEEGADLNHDSKLTWVCDPIDGTVPFSHGIPTAVFSLALVDDGQPILGVVYDPFMNRLFVAEKGKGATVNDTPLRVSTQNTFTNGYIGVMVWKDQQWDLRPFIERVIDADADAIGLFSIETVEKYTLCKDDFCAVVSRVPVSSVPR